MVMAYAIKSEENGIGIYEVSAGGTLSSPIAILADKGVSLRVELFPRNNLVYYYSGNKLVGISSVFYTPENKNLPVASATIASSEVGSVMTVDNVKLEALYGVFEKLTLDSAVNEERDPKNTITFESSSTGNIPSTINKSIYGANSSVSIQNMLNPLMNDGNGAWSNVLVAETFKGANDRVTFNSVSDLKEYSCVSFKMDVRIDATSKDHYYQLMFGANSNGTCAYMLQLSPNGTGRFKILDASNSSNTDGQVCTLATGMKFGEWINLEVKIFKGDRDSVRIQVYVNGEKIAVSSNFYGYEVDGKTPYDLIQSVSFYSFSATEAKLYIDNLSIIGTNESCTDDIDVLDVKEPGKIG